MNTDVLWPEREWVESQVLRIQTKLHNGRSMILIAGSMTCSTLCVTRQSSLLRGRGSGATEGSGRPERSSPPRRGFRHGCEMVSKSDSSVLCLCVNG